MAERAPLRAMGRAWTAEQALRAMRRYGAAAALRSVAREIIIESRAEGAGVRIDDEDVQSAADAIRASLGLYSSEQTLAWLDRQHMTVGDLDALARARALELALACSVVDDASIEARFAERGSAYGGVVLSRIRVPYEGIAREIALMIRDEGGDFCALAREHSTDETTRAQGGQAGVVPVDALADAAAECARAPVGAIIGPVLTGEGWELLRVEGHCPPLLDDMSRDAIRCEIFDEWLGVDDASVAVDIDE